MCYKGHGICKDTKIQTDCGLYMSESLRRDDMVIDHSGGKSVSVRFQGSTCAGCVKIETEVGFGISCGPFQKFNTEGGITAAEDMREDDLVWTVRGLARIIRMQFIPVLMSVVLVHEPDILFSAGGLLSYTTKGKHWEK